MFENVDPEYGHALVGKGLVVQIHDGTAPTEMKPARPSELKSGDGSGQAVSTTADEADWAAGDAGARAKDSALPAHAGEAGTVAAVPADDVSALGGTDQGGDDKALLIQQLEAAGVEFDRRWGTARLAAALAEAKTNEESA